MVENGDFVLPGEELGFSEELIAGRGTYEEDGRIYASNVGTLVIDMKERKMEVKPGTSVPPEPKVGDLVIGKIVDIKPQVAIVHVAKLEGVERGLPGAVTGVIRIANVRDSYVSDLEREFQVGDIVLAKIIRIERELQLTTVPKETGVIKSFCPDCNVGAEKVGRSQTLCPQCGKKRTGKLAASYGSGQV
ncbi:MAG: RNA-binding protein [Euryarchaeota archaeon]|nr:RNA-binding protein [Euryarchaeota archaeon]